MTKTFSPCPSGQESLYGGFYLAFQMLFLPSLLFWINDQLPRAFSETELNFVFYLVNFLAVLLIFRKFLGRNLRQLTQHPIDALQAAILGFVAYYACFHALEWLIGLLMPSYTNYNDQSIAALSRGNYSLMFLGTVILVPPVEECLYRGLIFRNLYAKSKLAAYLVSILAFAIIHIIGYFGQYSALELLLAVAQYLPAGLCLAWAYTRADTIFAPILIHAAINFIGIHAMR